MRPPKNDSRNKYQFDTSEEFFDNQFGWVKRISTTCPKCKFENTMAYLEKQGFKGCTNCSYVELLNGFEFVEGRYSQARKILETLYEEKRVEKPTQPSRFMPMNFKRK